MTFNKPELNTSGWNETMAAIFVFQLLPERNCYHFFAAVNFAEKVSDES